MSELWFVKNISEDDCLFMTPVSTVNQTNGSIIPKQHFQESLHKVVDL
jgi:hypothetical protein